jgi:hypothetical protein
MIQISHSLGKASGSNYAPVPPTARQELALCGRISPLMKPDYKAIPSTVLKLDKAQCGRSASVPRNFDDHGCHPCRLATVRPVECYSPLYNFFPASRDGRYVVSASGSELSPALFFLERASRRSVKVHRIAAFWNKARVRR